MHVTRGQSVSEHAREVHDTIVSRAANSPIASSWRRCILLHNLDPDTSSLPRRYASDRVASAQAYNAALMDAAAPHLDQVVKLLGEDRCSVLVTDRDGIVLKAAGVQDVGDREGWIGVDLSERSEGTNAVGTSLVERRPIAIIADEHFYARNRELACIGAPIFDPRGEVAGVIDITRPARPPNPTLDKAILAIVVETARRIEFDLFALAYPTERKVMASRNGGQYAAIVAVDASDRVVGATHAARQLLSLTRERMRTPFPAEALWPAAVTERGGTLAALERRAIESALAEHSDNISVTAEGARDQSRHAPPQDGGLAQVNSDRCRLEIRSVRRLAASAEPRRRNPRSAGARSRPA